jgi:tRNA threonylcarbamoyladenosine modification (KEOPS) complex  Pcc1 subunit
MAFMRCVLEVEFPDEKSLDAAAQAVSHEGSVGERATSSVMKRDKSLVVEIKAKDVVALRATANAYLRALQVFESVEEVRK